ncbi:DUF4367 domain-containing protein [Oliverpabstia intestinalis]|uniref:DUF4367 domain-containing protein n=1 Tax=Oliverpabstia intestinalis TaxID=2606633 RepID=UPI003F8A1E1F
MSKLYNEIMENIYLTPETKEQILCHVSERERKAKVQNMKKWTKYISVAACCALVVGAAYGIHTLHPDKTVSEEEDMTTADMVDDGAQIANPMKEYGSAEELSDAVGFTVREIGELPFTVKETLYFTYDDTLAEIRYTGDDQEVYFRKSQGEDEDNSGVYNTYSQTTTITVGYTEITCKGESDAYELAIWKKDGYSYSISLQTGISLEELQAMIETVEK